MAYKEPARKVEYTRERRNKARAKGYCIRCMCRPAMISANMQPMAYCQSCSKEMVESTRRRRAKVRLRSLVDRKENTISLYSLRMFINKAIQEGISEDTLLSVSHDRYLDLSTIFARKRS
jgi:DNA-binding transcriptional regulator YhcF (GntR family)